MRLVSFVCVIGAAAAAVGCASDTLDPPTGETRHYVLTSETIARTNAETRELALDLNDDGTIDNQLGMVFSTLANQGIPPADAAALLIASGALRVHAELQRAAPTDPDDTAAFAMFTREPHDRLLGWYDEPMLLGPGVVTTAIPFYGQVVELELVGARAKVAEIARGEDTILIGVIGGALRKHEVDTKLVGGFANMIETMVAAECTARMSPPECGCPTVDNVKNARYWLRFFDTAPTDCAVSEHEISTSSIVQSLLSPDLEIDGERVLSFGFGFEAKAR